MPKKEEKKSPAPVETTEQPPAIDNLTPDEAPEPKETPELADEWPDNTELSATPGEIETLAAETADKEKNKGGRPTNEERRKRLPILERLADMDSFEGVWLYLYRLRPVINKLMNGNGDTNIGRYDKPIDVQDILEEHGSGVYFVRATKQDPKTGKRPQFDMGEIKIMNMKYPPKVPPGQWVEHPKNAEWEWAKEAIFGKPKPAGDPLVDILKNQIERQERQMDELRKELRDTGKKDPQQETLLTIIARRLMEPPPPPHDPTLALTKAIELVKAMQPPAQEQSALEKLAIGLLTQKLSETRDPGADIEKTLELADKIRGSQGTNGGRSRKTGWQEVISDVGGPFMEMMKPFANAMAMGMMRANMPGAPPPQQQTSAQPQLPPAASVEPVEVSPAPAAPVEMRPGPQIVKPKPTDIDIASAILQHLANDWNGNDLGDWYIDNYGEAEFNEIRLQGKQRLMNDLATTPIWYDIRAYEDKLNELIDGFLTWVPEPEQEPEPEPVGVNVAPASSGISWGGQA